jgi:hypothetical protein
MTIKPWQPVLSLRPTQFSIGVLECEYKAKELGGCTRDKLRYLLRTTKIPVVVSPWLTLYVVDHHHFLFACWHSGICEVKVDVVKDYSDVPLTFVEFWERMTVNNLAYLYDQFGDGPRNPIYLPRDVRGMAEDPYRALAWVVRQEGGYDNTEEPFAEFKWADFFREHDLLVPDGAAHDVFQRAFKIGMHLAKSSSAKGLPGYTGGGHGTPPQMKKTKFKPLFRKSGDLANLPQFK